MKKTQSAVGSDFDAYAKEWVNVGYELEVKGADGAVIGRERSGAVQRPGDEWGLQSDLRPIYAAVVKAFAKPGANVLEIGSGAGRLTEVMAHDHAAVLGEYHTLDPSVEMTKVLQSRVPPGTL